MSLGLVKPFYQDAFSPVLLSADSLPLVISDEQKKYIKAVLDRSSSDSRFSDKAYVAIILILTKGMTKVAAVTSLVPSTVELGDPSFTLHVHGTGFKSTDQIVFNGGVEPTVFVSATELTTGVDMSTAAVAVTVPVEVVSADGLISNSMSFTFTDGSVSGTAFSAKTPEKKLVETKK